MQLKEKYAGIDETELKCSKANYFSGLDNTEPVLHSHAIGTCQWGIPLKLVWTFLWQIFICSVNLKLTLTEQTDTCQLNMTFHNDITWVWKNAQPGSTLQQHFDHIKMNEKCSCVQFILNACTSGYITYHVSQVFCWGEVTIAAQCFPWNIEEVITHVKQALFIQISFLNKRSINWWSQLKYYHSTAVTLQVRQCGKKKFTFCIHCANWQPHYIIE